MKYHDTMIDLLDKNLLHYLKSNVAKSVLKSECQSSTPFIFTSNSMQVSEAFINHVIYKKHNVDNNPVLSISDDDENIKSNMYMFQINFVNHHQIDFIDNICKQQGHFGNHVIVIHFVEQIRSNLALSLKSIINKFIHNTIFLLFHQTYVNIDRNIVNTCTRTNIFIDMNRYQKDFSEKIGIDFNSQEEDPMNLCLIAEYPEVSRNTFRNFVENYISEITKQTDFHKRGKLLRDFTLKIGASSIPVRILCKELIDIYSKRAYDNHKVLQIISDMEYHSKKTNKYIFVLEYHLSLLLDFI